MKFLKAGHGAPVFLLHGFAESARGWLSLMSELSRTHCVIAPDFPGFGMSATLEPCRSYEEMARTVVSTADALGFHRFSVLGHSMGGFVAQQLLVDYPPRIDSAVLYGTAMKMDSAKRFESAEQTLSRIREIGVSKATEGVIATWFSNGAEHPAFASCCSAAAEMTLEAAAAALHATRLGDFTNSLGTVATRVLVILGDLERSFPPEQAIEMKSTLKNAALCILPGCGHGAHLERADLFNTVVCDFLRRASPR